MLSYVILGQLDVLDRGCLPSYVKVVVIDPSV